MRRHLLGIIAGALLLAFFVLMCFGPADAQTRTYASICMRAGLVLGAMWLAFPQLTRLLARFPLWLIASLGLGIMLLLANPKLLTIVVPLLVAVAVVQFIGWLFKPLPKSPPPPRSDEPSRTAKDKET